MPWYKHFIKKEKDKAMDKKLKTIFAVVVMFVAGLALIIGTFRGTEKVHAEYGATHVQIKTFTAQVKDNTTDVKNVDNKVNVFLKEHESARLVNASTTNSQGRTQYFVTVKYDK